MKTLVSLLLMFLALPVSAQYRDVKMPSQPKQTNYRDYSSQNQGFWFATEAEGGSSVMEHHRNCQYTMVTFTGGYRLSEYLRVGAGFGGKMYVNNSEVRGIDSKYGFPIFANLRGNFISASERDGVPFWSVNVGGIVKEGLYLSPSVGYSFGGLRNNFQVGVTYTYTDFKNDLGDKRKISYFGLKIGYEF